MNQDEMYDYMRTLQRKGADPLPALHDTLLKAGSIMQHFRPGDKHLYVRCDDMPPSSVKIIDFLAGASFLTWRIVAIANEVIFAGSKETIGTPYILIYKK